MDTINTFSRADLCEVVLGGLCRADYPDFADAFLFSAKCAHTGRALTVAELDSVGPDVVHGLVRDYLSGSDSVSDYLSGD